MFVWWKTKITERAADNHSNSWLSAIMSKRKNCTMQLLIYRDTKKKKNWVLHKTICGNKACGQMTPATAQSSVLSMIPLASEGLLRLPKPSQGFFQFPPSAPYGFLTREHARPDWARGLEAQELRELRPVRVILVAAWVDGKHAHAQLCHRVISILDYTVCKKN